MGEDEHRVELGVQPSSLWKEASQDLYPWKGILLEEKPKRDSRKQENPLRAQAVALKHSASCSWTPSKFMVGSSGG